MCRGAGWHLGTLSTCQHSSEPSWLPLQAPGTFESVSFSLLVAEHSLDLIDVHDKHELSIERETQLVNNVS